MYRRPQLIAQLSLAHSENEKEGKVTPRPPWSGPQRLGDELEQRGLAASQPLKRAADE
jgi:hypothetical protein